MSTNLRALLNDAADTLLEPPSDQTSAPALPALSLGLFTQQQFMDAFTDVALEFLRETAFSQKKIDSDPTTAPWLVPLFGVSQYVLPDFISDLHHVIYNGTVLYPDESGSLDDVLGTWGANVGPPLSFRQDLQTRRKFSLTPAPNSPVQNPDSMSVVVSMLLENAPAMDQPIEKIPDSFLPYIECGVESIAFGTDSEVKDEMRSKYARQVFDMGVETVKGIMKYVEATQ